METKSELTLIKKYSKALKALSVYALKYNLMLVAYYLTRLYFLTVRVKPVDENNIRQHLQEGKKAIAAIWHQRIITAIGYAKSFAVYRPAVMISGSRDGDLIASVFSRMNFRPVRGSSSRHGKKALMAMVDYLQGNNFAVHVLDGPKGPKGVIKPGLIIMAEKSGVPVMPVYLSVTKAWVLRSWDNCLVPKPFSKIVIRWDKPMDVPREMTEQEFEEKRIAIEKHMLENQRHDDALFGWNNLI
ncbi:MAG TPA: lysophospholipid acyltransferase family protein [Smithellaceae bacterium]|nr:lysophospholipid acyltransferase family protein [Smithellaceae bacterium]